MTNRKKEQKTLHCPRIKGQRDFFPGTATGQTGKKGKKLQFVSTEDCAKHSLKNEWTLKTIFDPFVVMAPHCFGEDAFSVFTSLAYGSFRICNLWPHGAKFIEVVAKFQTSK